MPDGRWREPEFDRNVNPVPSICTDEVVSLAKGRVLDFGCGFGRLSERFASGYYLGVDIAKHRIEKAARTHYDKEFLWIDSVKDLRGLQRIDSVIVDNVFIHVPDEEMVTTLGVLCSIAPDIIIAEHLGREWRNGRMENQHRDLEDYRALFSDEGFCLDMKIEVMNPRWNKNLTVARWTSE